ncbi:conserved hypothetical protein [Culex quinquefasciatus]|uniref:BTB domain-containing protein n=1 Tax=Culex quinquefasciatus TaxID=7176 RepID=B0W2Y2_CULQU|nr:conserved hypothetical protein [Culex quinquefasciatus]|eukprot:XP_001843066.1 conserved hypothetical protein [Culex quinquefasciatus]
MINGYRGFAEYAKDLFNEPALADVVILLDNDHQDQENGTESTRTFHGHRVVLATMSNHFQTLLGETEKREIHLKDVPYSTFELCVRFVYCGWDDRLANCGLKMDGFLEASLATVQKIIAVKVMSCSKGELHEVMTRWVTANKNGLCTKKLKAAASIPAAKSPQESLDTSRECSFSSEMVFHLCLNLFGVTLAFKSIEKVRSELIVSRKVRIDCDFTLPPQQVGNTLIRNIFFLQADQGLSQQYSERHRKVDRFRRRSAANGVPFWYCQ